MVNLGTILNRINLVKPFHCAAEPAASLLFLLLMSSAPFTYLDGEPKPIESILTQSVENLDALIVGRSIKPDRRGDLMLHQRLECH